RRRRPKHPRTACRGRRRANASDVFRRGAAAARRGVMRQQGSAQTLDEPSDALERIAKFFLRVGVGEAQVALAEAAQCRSGEGCDAGFTEQEVGKLRRLQAQARYVGKNIERSAWLPARETGDGVQSIDDEIAPAAELRHHGLRSVLGTSKRGDAGDLDEAR